MVITIYRLIGGFVLGGCLLVVSGCAAQNTANDRVQLKLDRQRIELTRLRIELTKAALQRIETDQKRLNEMAKDEEQERTESAQLRSQTVAFLRTMAKDKGKKGAALSSLADWVNAGGDPQIAMRAALGGGLPR
jgi:hypothetical protein